MKKIFKVSLLAFTFYSFFFSPKALAAACDYVVDDVAGLLSAKSTIRTLNNNMTKDIVVCLKGDNYYYLDSTISFDSQDSGRNGKTIIYKNYPNEQPIIIGGQPITNWQSANIPGKPNIWKANVGSWKFYALMENGVVSTMARYPNSGWLNIVDAQESCRDCPREVWFTYTSEDIPNFDDSDAQVHVITGGPGYTEWRSFTLPILDINRSDNKITVQRWGTWHPLRVGDRYRLRGSLDFLDEA